MRGTAENTEVKEQGHMDPEYLSASSAPSAVKTNRSPQADH